MKKEIRLSNCLVCSKEMGEVRANQEKDPNGGNGLCLNGGEPGHYVANCDEPKQEGAHKGGGKGMWTSYGGSMGLLTSFILVNDASICLRAIPCLVSSLRLPELPPLPMFVINPSLSTNDMCTVFFQSRAACSPSFSDLLLTSISSTPSSGTTRPKGFLGFVEVNQLAFT